MGLIVGEFWDSGMWLGAAFLALHMSLTHSITLSMIGSYMPTGEVKGVGKLSGTAWSVTDFILGKELRYPLHMYFRYKA